VLLLRRLQKLKETIVELTVLSKAVLETFWFWVPPLFAAYIFLQLWLVFFVHPLTLAILPSILAVYALIQEDKRVRAMYGLESAKKKSAADPFGAAPKELKGFEWDVEKALQNYETTLEGKSEKKKGKKS